MGKNYDSGDRDYRTSREARVLTTRNRKQAKALACMSMRAAASLMSAGDYGCGGIGRSSGWYRVK